MKHNRLYVWVLMTIASINLTFAAIPGVPTNVNARLEGSSIVLTWQAPTNGGTPTGYKLYYDGDSYGNSYRNPQLTLSDTVSGTSKSILVSSLEPSFNIHVFAVSAYNSSGESSLSEGEYTSVGMDYKTGDTVLLTGDGTSHFMAVAHPELHQEIDINSQNDTVIFPPLNIGILLNKSAEVQYSFKSNPAGMTLDSKTGAVTYIAPNTLGTYSAIVLATWQSMRLEIPVTVSVYQTPDLEFVDFPAMVAQSGSLFRTRLTARHKSDSTAVIRYELSPNSPSEMTIDSVSGVIEYRVPSNEKEAVIDLGVLVRCQGNCIGISGDFQLIVTENRVQAHATPQLSSGIVGTPIGVHSSPISIYAKDLAGSSDSFEFSLENAPAGMRLVDGDSAYPWVKYIDWTPTNVGTYTFEVVVKGTNGAWGSDTVKFNVDIYDKYTVSNLAPSFTDVNKTLTYLPIVKNSSGDTATNLRFEPATIATLNTELEIVDPDYFTNGVVEFDSTNGKLRWTPSATGFLYFTGNIFDGDRLVANYYAKVYSFDLSKVDTAEIAFATFPNTAIKPELQWQYSPSMVNKYLGVQEEASFSLIQGPMEMTVDSSSYFTWTPTATGIYEVAIEAQTINNKKSVQPFMILVANHFEPNSINGRFNMYPYNWCQVGENIKNAYGVLDPLNRFEVAALDSTQEDLDLAEVRYTLENGPEGMSIDSITGVVDWTPTQQGVWDVTVKAFYPNKAGVARVTLSFFAFDMPEKTVSMLVKNSPRKVTSVKTQEDRISAKLSVAPMPARDILKVQIPNIQNTASSLKFSISDLQGSLLFTQNEKSSANGEYILQVDSLPQGTYVLVVEMNNQRSATPILIVR